MTTAFVIYTGCWLTAMALSLYWLYQLRNQAEILRAEYKRFLLEPWRLIFFIPALLVMVLIAPYTGDYTWDYVDASFMSILTYLTAPWALGTIYRNLKSRQPDKKLFIAVCLWLFSASWSYDIYIYLRDGFYPGSWLPNLFASSVLYICAGLFWSLEYREGRGMTFAFMEEPWFMENPQTPYGKILLFGGPFVLLVATMILAFVYDSHIKPLLL